MHAPWVSDRDHRLTHWLNQIDEMPDASSVEVDLASACVRIGAAAALDTVQHERMYACLKSLMPWRKGPFSFFGRFVDTEWRSDLKWDRVAPQISSLEGRHVLDVGCGSGYHCWRMRGVGAKMVIGLEPSLLFCSQFRATQRYIRDEQVQVLPLRLEDFPGSTHAFHTTFSMGVLYHRRSPFDHLIRLRETLQQGGELVLETLVVDGPLHHVFVPRGRYAQMRNVWCLPSVLTLEHWLGRVGFDQIRTVDVTVTTIDEQRQTNWIHGQSLDTFLHAEDPTLTIEGYPAPKRATIIARRI